MVAAVDEVLRRTDAQVIWKFVKNGQYKKDVLEPLQPYISNGRLRLFDWQTVDRMALLETGNIVSSIHHGGSNCYHETIA
jgi:hypothetical protein